MRLHTVLMLALFATLSIPVAEAKTYKLYYLGGQSNMDGFGFVKELPAELNQPVEGVMIFHGNAAPDGAPVDGRGNWSVLRPGHGTGFESTGNENRYSDRFGVELTFAARLKELDPASNIALLKYSRGGTSIAVEAAAEFGCWDPDFYGGEGDGKGVNQWDHFLAAVRSALSVQDIDGDEEPDVLIPAGIVWMQGESDAAHTRNIAERYQQNLKRLMDLIRATLRVDDLPVVIGRISESGCDEDGKVWDFANVVRSAQGGFVEQDIAAALVTSTDAYGYSDPWHYDSAGYIDLGKRFADAIFEVSDKK